MGIGGSALIRAGFDEQTHDGDDRRRAEG